MANQNQQGPPTSSQSGFGRVSDKGVRSRRNHLCFTRMSMFKMLETGQSRRADSTASSEPAQLGIAGPCGYLEGRPNNS